MQRSDSSCFVTHLFFESKPPLLSSRLPGDGNRLVKNDGYKALEGFPIYWHRFR